MIDIDRIEAQLDSALTHRPGPARPAPTAQPAQPARRAQSAQRARPAQPAPRPPRARPRPSPVPASASELLELGMVDEADAAMAATSHPRDALTWRTMRALLDGRRDATRTGVDEMRRLAQRTDDAEALDRYWIQRFWAAVEWGPDEERYDVLDHCRERAYRFDDLEWWGNLTVLLATLGKQDEAVRAIDDAAGLVAAGGSDPRRLDAVTNMVDAAARLGDAGRLTALARPVRWPDGRLVLVRGGVVCKGSADRYRALAYAAEGKWDRARECFRRAEAAHRVIGARLLLERTLQQASGPLVAA